MDDGVQVVVLMGVSGSGKSVVAAGVSRAMGWRFAEGDDFHSQNDVRGMRSGRPLTDEDRAPWLRRIAGWIDRCVAEGASAVVTCSAVRAAYRDLLRDGRDAVRFCHLVGDAELIRDRLDRRTGHFMPPELLPSQLAILEPLSDAERAAGDFEVSIDQPVEAVVREVVGHLRPLP